MLSGKVAVVTGASRGIGRAIALKLASLGASVAVIYNGSKEKAEEVKGEASKLGAPKAQAYQCDVSDGERCAEVIKKVTEELGAVDILVNNAGITKDGLLITMDEADFESVIDTNLKGCFNMTKACSRGFIKKKYGKIINISSVSGISGLPGQANYSSSKAGVIALTKVTAKELGAKNVCCNAIAPGFIVTDMTEDLMSGSDEFLKSIPLKRLGKTDDVANLAAFLASEASDYITGEVIRIDGGLTM